MIFNAFFVFMLTCCQASNIELPISMDPNGGYWINATIESNGAVFPIRAKLRYFPNALFPTSDDGTVLRIEGDTSSVRIDLSRGGSQHHAILGVAPGGSLLNRTGSVAIVRDVLGSKLVLNNTQEYWEGHCVANTVITFPIDGSDVFMLAIPREISFNLEDSSRAPIEWNRSLQCGLSSFLLDTITLVPEPIFQRIEELIIEGGGVRVSLSETSRRPNYLNCTDNLIQTLPDLTISWPSIGRITLVGSDYMHHKPEIDTCGIRLRILEETDHMIFLDPLQLHQINIMIATDSLRFCDPQY